MGVEGTRSPVGRFRGRVDWPPVKPLLPSRADQVAAVCYRIRDGEIEFLLVKTRRGRWTFPKGGAESGLTRAQAAALEAFEEAGVHGRIEEVSFTRYRRGKRSNRTESGPGQTVVHAFLCDVARLVPPQELNRNRTWFSPDQAKSQLSEDRDSENGADLARVVDTAVRRIRRLRRRNSLTPDPLQAAPFEASEVGALRGQLASLVQRFRRKSAGSEDPAAAEFAVRAYLHEVMQLDSGRLFRGNRAMLESGKTKRAADVLQPRKVVQINRSAKPAENS